MDDAGERGDVTCPGCGERPEQPALRCPDCGESLVADELAEAVERELAATEPRTAPRWAVLLTGLALGIAVAPLVAYAALIAAGDLPPLVLAGLLLAGWLGTAAVLAGRPSPSAALARGLAIVVGGVALVLAALAYDALSAGPSAVAGETGWVALLLALPAVVAAVLARRVAGRAARQARGEPGPLHERAGLTDDEVDTVAPSDDRDER
ncbi:zinc ribbon domain-containing protein [Haloarcula litorea]|uniref:zinc ribbon domain-containing protein n=1 Tax=Haloarcula litorea TaxID=3032579 RepID=UPI0023E8A9B0|nr:zinc ribbon domain-containing protein [Halomicroarcula sp. GDY20]